MFNGYQICKKIIKTVEDLKNLPALYEAYNLSKDIKGIKYIGYLPAAGQMKIINRYFDMLQYIFAILGFKLHTLKNNVQWTCHELSDSSAIGVIDNAVCSCGKYSHNHIFPIFKQIYPIDK